MRNGLTHIKALDLRSGDKLVEMYLNYTDHWCLWTQIFWPFRKP